MSLDIQLMRVDIVRERLLSTEQLVTAEIDDVRFAGPVTFRIDTSEKRGGETWLSTLDRFGPLRVPV